MSCKFGVWELAHPRLSLTMPAPFVSSLQFSAYCQDHSPLSSSDVPWSCLEGDILSAVDLPQHHSATGPEEAAQTTRFASWSLLHPEHLNHSQSTACARDRSSHALGLSTLRRYLSCSSSHHNIDVASQYRCVHCTDNSRVVTYKLSLLHCIPMCFSDTLFAK